MLHCIATIELQPGKRSAFLAEFAKLVPLVLAEAGCIEYGSAIDTPTPIAVQIPLRPDTVTVVEKWESLQHPRDHLAAPHMAAYRETVKDLVKGLSLQILGPA